MLVFRHFYLTIKKFSGDLCGVSPREYGLLFLPILRRVHACALLK